MRNYKVIGISFVLLFTMLLSACQNESPESDSMPAPVSTNAPAVAETIPTTAPTVEPTQIQKPVNPVNPDEPYPSPLEIVFNNPYPPPIDSEQIDWNEVNDFIMKGLVGRVFQSNSLEVVITLVDGKVFLTQEPERNAIFELIEECGESCYGIRKVTEY
jgi:hypothetical protein